MKKRKNEIGPLEIVIPLYLIAIAGRQFRGRTRLQKLVFLTQKRLRDAIDFEFAPAEWGPLSYRLYQATEKLRSLGMLKETTQSTPSGKNVICFQVTDEGRKFIDFALAGHMLPTNVKRAIEAVQTEYGSLPVVNLVSLVHEKYPSYVDSRD